MMAFLYRLLEIPWVYRIVVRILALGGMRFRRKIDKEIFDRPTYRVLDVGCGPDPIAPDPVGLLVGLDVNEAYIEKYTGGFVDKDPQLIFHPPEGRKRLGYVGSGDKLPFADGAFDEIRTSSFFHHIPDEEVIRCIQEIVRCTQKGGRLIMFDTISPKSAWTRPLAYLITKYDRGRFMRSEEQLVQVIQKACPGPWQWKRHTYTYTGMELLCLQYIKP